MTHEVYFPDCYSELGEFQKAFVVAKKEKFVEVEKEAE